MPSNTAQFCAFALIGFLAGAATLDPAPIDPLDALPTAPILPAIVLELRELDELEEPDPPQPVPVCACPCGPDCKCRRCECGNIFAQLR